MNPSEKHILEIDSVELSFATGIFSSVPRRETGGITAVLGRTVRQGTPDEDISSLRADFPVDAHRRGGMTVSRPTRCVTSRSRVLSRAG